MSKIAVIGTGFSGLSAAAYLADAGHDIHVYEKNASAGGRARQLKTAEGYIFDMGPSWYWMPGVFEKFFEDFGLKVSDLYDLKLLDPSFEVVFGSHDSVMIPSDFSELTQLFESIEEGAGDQLLQFMAEAQYKYETGMENLVYMPGISILEFADLKLMSGVFKLQVFSSFSKHVKRFFRHPKLIALMEFPVLFLGAMPQDTPALYSLMNYAGLKLGTWYPNGGFGSVISAIQDVAKTRGAQFHFNCPVEKIEVSEDNARGIWVNGELVVFDVVIASADYNHVEQSLLPPSYRNYTPDYWEKRVFAPSCLIYYLGLNKRLNNISHHTLFFEEELLQHSIEIYKDPKWPTKPLFYVCCPTQTDEGIAPAGHESLFLLMPLAPGLSDTEDLRDDYFKIMLKRLEDRLGEEIESFIDFKQSYCVNDFIADYNSFKGNAYGLANTLMQTAILKPKMRNRKISNLFYTGQLTVPGPGVPPALISGKLAAEQAIKYLKNTTHETLV